MSIEQFDSIIIGTGQAGPGLARELAADGRKTAIIERQLVGGTCINYGCTPTKTMVASARVAHLARNAEKWGVNTGSPLVDLAKVIGRKDDIVTSFRDGNEKRLNETDNLELIFGHARFTADTSVEVSAEDGSTRRLQAGNIFINTGMRPAFPPVEGLDAVGALTNETIMQLDEIPEKLVVIGGGFIGLEFGQMFRRFGSEVTIVARNERLMHRDDEDVCSAIADFIREDGIELCLGAELVGAEKLEDGVCINVVENGKEKRFKGSHMLVAIGRVPNTDDLGLEHTGLIRDEKGYIPVDDVCRTTVDGIWALGDCTGAPPFTHIAYDDYRIVADQLLGTGTRSRAGRLVPYVLYTDPQYGRVGLNEEEAGEAGIEYRVASIPNTYVARSIETGETAGLLKALVDPESGHILGAAVVATEGGELMTMLQLAMMGGLTADQLQSAVFAHPTYAEALNTLFGHVE